MKSKARVIVLVLAYVLFYSCTLVYANQTILTTRVPSDCKIELIIVGDGQVNMNGKTYSTSSTIDVKRNTRIDLVIMPKKSWTIKSVLLNKDNITSSTADNKIYPLEIGMDCSLEVCFDSEEFIINQGRSSHTGDTTDKEVFIFLLFTSMMSMVCISWLNGRKGN